MSDNQAGNVPGELILNPLFVPLALEAGIGATIRSLVNAEPMDIMALAVALRVALWDVNEPLARGINRDTLAAILAALDDAGETVAISSKKLAPSTAQAGPEGVFASYSDGTVFVTFSAPPAGWQTLIVVDGVIVKLSDATDENASGTADDTVVIALSAGDHTVRAVYRRVEDGALSLMGGTATITV